MHLSVALFRAEQPFRAGVSCSSAVPPRPDYSFFFFFLFFFSGVCFSPRSHLTNPRGLPLHHTQSLPVRLLSFTEDSEMRERVSWATKKATTLPEWTLSTVEWTQSHFKLPGTSLLPTSSKRMLLPLETSPSSEATHKAAQTDCLLVFTSRRRVGPRSAAADKST